MFYFFYKLDFVIGNPWWSEFKPLIFISGLEGLLIVSFGGVIQVLTGYDLLATDAASIGVVVFTSVVRLLQFHINESWKGIIEEYDNFDSKERRVKLLRMVLVIIIVILIFVSSLYLAHTNVGDSHQ